MNNKTFLKTFRILAFIEGISLLILFLIAMPMKYMFDSPQLISPVGMAHGVLFIAYVIFTFLGKMTERWSVMDTIIILVASFIPFGTFYVEKKYLKQ